jgi:hypothetical protein
MLNFERVTRNTWERYATLVVFYKIEVAFKNVENLQKLFVIDFNFFWLRFSSHVVVLLNKEGHCKH